MNIGTIHRPVLLEELVELMDIASGQVIVDCTLGGGGHFFEVLKKIGKTGTLVGIDVSRKSIELVCDKLKAEGFKEKINDKNHIELKKTKLRIILVNDNFKNIKDILTKLEIINVNGVYADLGFSSDQLEEDLSFKKEGELDLRLDKTLGVRAKDLVNALYEKELIKLFEMYSDEKYSRDIAKEIIRYRALRPIERKEELVTIIGRAVGEKNGKRNNTEARIFQALRMAVNDEINVLKSLLKGSIELLGIDGKLAVISFHSGEDRIVKKEMMNYVREGGFEWVEKLLTPSNEEITQNKRSRSAKLRVIEKIGS